MAVINASAADYIPFQEGRSSVPNPSHSFDVFSLSDTAFCATKDGIVLETLPMGEAPRNKDIDLEATDTLSFWDNSGRGHNASAFDLVGFVDFGGLFHGGPSGDSLSIVEDAETVLNKPGLDDLSLTEVASVLINPLLEFEETLELVEAAIGFKFNCSPVDVRQQIILEYPGQEPTTGIATLCIPVFGDIRRRDFQRINRRSRGNDLIIFRDPTWVVSDHITIRLNNLNTQQRLELINFLEFTTGLIVRMTDYENNIWRGFIMNPNTPITQTGNCRYSCELQFSGAVIQNGNV